jgi:acyl-coenzyme A synthetase/AMP-(fatty) acid ligase
MLHDDHDGIPFDRPDLVPNLTPVVSRPLWSHSPLVVDIDDEAYLGAGERLGSHEYEDFVAKGDEAFELTGPEDEWEPIALNYTSGTTGGS